MIPPNLHNGSMPADTDPTHLRGSLHRRYRPGVRLGADCDVVEVRDAPGEVVLLVRWQRDPRLYGVPIPLGDTRRDFYSGDPVESDEEWLDSVSLGLTILVDTGFEVGARRTAVGDHIELRTEGSWPDDERFYYDVVDPADPASWERVRVVAEDGLDPAAALASRDAGRLIAWVTGYENNSAGSPYVGHAVVSWTGATTAHVEHVEVAEGVPVTVLVDLVHLAAHAAGSAGALVVTTDRDEPELGVAGFRERPGGPRVVDTGFLEEDPAGAARLLKTTRAAGGTWGRDRDVAGRHLPDGRMGRWWHRLKHGATGAAPRRYAG